MTESQGQSLVERLKRYEDATEVGPPPPRSLIREAIAALTSAQAGEAAARVRVGELEEQSASSSKIAAIPQEAGPAGAAANEWRSIETAPRDGTHILGVLDHLPEWPVPLWWAPYADEWRCPFSEEQGERGRWSPVAWMPCPDVEAPRRANQPSFIKAKLAEIPDGILDPLGLEVVARLNALGEKLPEHGRVTRDDILRRIDVKIDAILALLPPSGSEGWKPITMQDVRLAVGEGPLSATDVLTGANAELRRRAHPAGRP